MRKTREEAEETRHQLLESALDVFSSKGYAATRLSDVAAAAGVTRGAIYWHFQNKQDLFFELIKSHIDPFTRIVSDIAEENLNPIEVIERILQKVPREILKSSKFAANQKLQFMKLRLSGELPEIKELLLSNYQSIEKKIENVILRGQQRGEIILLPPRVVLMSMLVFLNGVGNLLVEAGDLVNLEKHLDSVTQIFMRGIRK